MGIEKGKKELTVKKSFVFLMIFCLLLSCSIVAVADGDTKTLLSLGDSISAGYGLADPEKETFVYNVFDGLVENYAVSGNTAEDVWAQLQDEKNSKYVPVELIKNADVVTITCGGNDLMAILYEKVADAWNEANPDKELTAEEALSKLASGDLGLLMTTVNLFDSSSETYLINDGDFDAALDKYTETLKKITTYVNMNNPRCAVIVATQYNPYVEFKGTFFDVVYKGMEDGVGKLNKAILDNAAEGGYIVSDVKSEFDASADEGDLYNADPNNMNVDFHPTANGHKILARSFGKTVSEIKYVKYSVSHFYERLDGTFEEEKTEGEAVVGVNVYAVETVKEGYSLVSNENEVRSASATEGVVLKLYYSRNKYSVKWKNESDEAISEYRYGEQIVVPKLDKKGYKFMGWDKEVPEKMPSTDLTFTAVWEKDLNIPLVVFVCVFSLVVVAVIVFFVKKEK